MEKHTNRILLALACLALVALPAFAGKIVLSKDGKTDYKIVKAEKPSDMDDYAADFLAEILKRKTDADFMVVTLEKAGKKAIYVGTKAPKGLKEDEFVCESEGDNIYLYGEGIHGAVNAVSRFLEDKLGVRWYETYLSAASDPVLTQEKTLLLDPFSVKKGFVFKYRMMNGGTPERNCWAGINMGIEEDRFGKIKRNWKKNLPDPRLKSKKLTPIFVHSNVVYMPDNPGRGNKPYIVPWLTKHDWGKTHPQYFPLTKDGKRRTVRNVCWSNPEVRKHFMEQLEKTIEAYGENLILVLDPDDDGQVGPMCWCEGCKKLDAQYGNPTGALYDFVLEVANKFKKAHPQTVIRTSFRWDSKKDGIIQYRIPKLPENGRFPDNVSIFVPNARALNKMPDAPENAAIFKFLKDLKPIAPSISFWYYGTFFCETLWMAPFSNLQQSRAMLQAFRDTGIVDGMFYEMVFSNSTYNFSALLRYAYPKLLQNPDQPLEPIVEDFTDYHYGAAAEGIRKYFNELEGLSLGMKNALSPTPKPTDFPYLTPERIHRWQEDFDKMEKLVKNDKRSASNLAQLRYTLDFATLMCWNKVSQNYPEYFKNGDMKEFRRIKDRMPHSKYKDTAKQQIDKLDQEELLAGYAENPKPLPPEFDQYKGKEVIRLFPTNFATKPFKENPKKENDPDAAFGFSVGIHKPDLPFCFGFYQFDEKGKMNAPRITAKDIVPGKYKFYKLGEVRPTPNSIIWFSNRSWTTNVQCASLVDLEGNPAQIWDAWVSLKFPENYQGKDTDPVRCDQIIFFKK